MFKIDWDFQSLFDHWVFSVNVQITKLVANWLEQFCHGSQLARAIGSWLLIG